MPLIDDSTNKCLLCGTENGFSDSDVRIPDDDDFVFTIDCPGCGASESFMFHDDVAMKQVVEMRPYPEDIEGESPETSVAVSWIEPDPEGFDAVHGTLVESASKRLGRKQRKGLRPPDRPDYPVKPKKPQKAAMRKLVDERVEKHKPKAPMGKAEADSAYESMVDDAKKHAQKRKAEKEAIRSAKMKSKYKGPQEEILPPGKMGKEDAEPKVDKPKKKAFPRKAQPYIEED